MTNARSRRRVVPGSRSGQEPYELVAPATMAGLQKWRALPEEQRRRQEQSWSTRMQTCIAWAEEHGVRLGRTGGHPDWLLGKTVRRNYDSLPSWLDHPLYWVKDRRPAAITASLYGYEHREDEVHGWVAGKPGIGLATGPGWYHDGTVQIVLWNRDVLGEAVTAADAGPNALRWLAHRP
ncbi:hypothetical protein ACFVVA_40215 [Kitasatospora sp. NPDC058048]|uniref:hypothetical protein n=1 Tax=Kitasatospora sp. NPDC058048 TaxID=3346313 RepID=UPI0036D7F43F